MSRTRARALFALLPAGFAIVLGGCSSGGSPTTAAADMQTRQQEAALARSQPRGLTAQADAIAQSAMSQSREPAILAGVPDDE